MQACKSHQEEEKTKIKTVCVRESEVEKGKGDGIRGGRIRETAAETQRREDETDGGNKRELEVG